MKISKTEKKQAIIERLDASLRGMYHNARMAHIHTVDVDSQEVDEWFEEAAYFAIEALRSKLDYTDKEMRRGAWLGNKHMREMLLVTKITEYGELYTWGRGGATLAPDNLINNSGCVFTLKKGDDFEEKSNSELVEMVQIIDAFNEYVQHWNSEANLQAIFNERCEVKIEHLMFEARQVTKDFRLLAKDARKAVVGNAICHLVTSQLQHLRTYHKLLMSQIVAYRNAIKGV